MDHKLFLTNSGGGSIELVEFFCELQNQNLQRYYYILENKLCWRDSPEAVAQEILMIDNPRRYKGYHYWTILCQAKWKDGIFAPLTNIGYIPDEASIFYAYPRSNGMEAGNEIILFFLFGYK